MQVSQAASFASCHSDLIHDTVYDYYGTTLATCSSDQRLAVHEKTETGWSLVDVWKGHDASILRLAWSHPEYGRLLVSCGMDRTVRVWEENTAGVLSLLLIIRIQRKWKTLDRKSTIGRCLWTCTRCRFCAASSGTQDCAFFLITDLFPGRVFF